MSARSQGERRLALAAAAEFRHGDLADALGEARELSGARELVDMLDAVGRHDQVAQLRLERRLRARGYTEEADRVA